MSIRATGVATAAWALMCVALAPTDTSASCNTIPNMLAIRSATSGFPTVDVPLDLPFRGDFGRIDRAVVVPGVTPEIVAGRDPQCDPPGADSIAKETIGLILRQTVPGKSAQVVAFTAKGASQTTTNIANGLGQRLHVPEFRVSNRALSIRQGENAGARFALPLDDHDGPGRLSVMVLESSVIGGNDSLAWLNGSKESSPCQELAARLKAAHQRGAIHACVDRIYDDYIRDERCKTENRNVDALAVAAFMTAEENDFRKECDGLGDGATSDLVPCRADADGLSITVHTGGMLEIPFSYEAIRKYKDEHHKPKSADRELSGRSALSRASQVGFGRIFVPGREFLGSVAPGSNPGNPRRPDIDVSNPLAGTQELQVTGSVDQDASLVRFYPRVPVAFVCGSNPEQACQAFSRAGEAEKAICACEEAGKDDGCEGVCQPLVDPRYYECEGGAFDGLPCTRPRHCGEGGTCSAKPRCVPALATWNIYSVIPQNACWSDAECTTAGFPQCGYRLFDLASRAPAGVYTTQYEIVGTTAPDQSGVCKNNRNIGCSNSLECPSGNGPCLGYSLRAHGTKRDN